MSFIKLLYSLFVLGFLFFMHIIKYPFARGVNGTEFINRFKNDNIDIIRIDDLELLYKSSECINCDLCSSVISKEKFILSSDICSRITRDPASYRESGFSKDNFVVGECPYNIEIKRISDLIS